MHPNCPQYQAPKCILSIKGYSTKNEMNTYVFIPVKSELGKVILPQEK